LTVTFLRGSGTTETVVIWRS